MKDKRALLVTNIPVPYRRELYRAFCNVPRFESEVLFSELSYNDVSYGLSVIDMTGAEGLDRDIRYSVLGGGTLRTLHSKMPFNLNLLRKLVSFKPSVVVLGDFSPLNMAQAIAYKVIFSNQTRVFSMTDETSLAFSRLSFKPLRWLVRRIVLEMANGCICSSDSGRRHIEWISKKMKDKCIVSYLTPELSYYSQPRFRTCNTKRLIRVITVCRLVRDKRVDRLLLAMNEVAVKYGLKDWQMMIVGDGPEEENLRNVARSTECAEHFIFAGRVTGEKLRDLYKSADVFALASEWEPWGVVVEEAMLSGLACVVTDSVGASQIVREGGGRVIDTKGRDESALISAIAEGLADVLSDRVDLDNVRREGYEYMSRITPQQEISKILSFVFNW